MSDSEEELIPNSVNTFIGHTTSYSLKHNVNSTCMSGFNYRNNNMSSLSYNMHPNYRSHNFREHSLDQRSMYNRRELSPMSMRSVPDFRPHNMQYSYYRSEMGYHKSPTSVRSMDTTASTTVSAADIAQAFKMAKFNKYDYRVIKDAYTRYMKGQVRKRIEKRRNLKSFLKRNRRQSGYDSGELGSDSSISSDDCKSTRSIRSTIPKENILRPINRSNRSEILKLKNTMQVSDMYKDCTQNFKQNSMKTIFNESTSKNSNNLGKIQNSTVGTQKERFTKGFQLPSHRFNKLINTSNIPKNNETLLCEKAYANNQLLKKCGIQKGPNMSDSENEEIFSRNPVTENCSTNSFRQKKITVDNEHSDNNIKNKTVSSNRSISISDINRANDFHFKKPQAPFRKQINVGLNREKLIASSQPLVEHVKHNKGQITQIQTSENFKDTDMYNKNVDIIRLPISRQNEMCNNQTNKDPCSGDTDSEKDEIFANIIVKERSMGNNLSIQQKRALEAEGVFCSESKRSKIAPIKSKNENIVNKTTPDNCKKLQEKSISTIHLNTNPKITLSNSKQQLNKSIEHVISINNNETVNDSEKGGEKTNSEVRILSISDVSMRPSFIKRKLFTQKLDVTEKRTTSNDSKNSPCAKNYNSREKNKVRKLATSQSCLSRDVLGDNNVLDLIHKIVPPDQMNMTNATNKRDIRISNPDDEDKWDVTSVISMCNDNNVSDTYTDEEIFELNHKSDKIKKGVDNELPKQKSIKTQMQCKVMVDKLHPIQVNKVQNRNHCIEPKLLNKISVASCIRSFWDTDCDSDDAEVRNLSKDKLLREKGLKNNNETTTTLKDSLLTANGRKSNLISTIRKESCQILNGKTSSNCHITKQTNNKVLNQNLKVDSKKKSTRKVSNQKNQEDPKTGKQQKKSTNVLKSQKMKENITNQSQTSDMSHEHSIMTRSLRLRNKKNQDESQSSTGDNSILTRSLSLKMKEKLDGSQSSSGERGIMTRSMMIRNKKLNDSHSSTGDLSVVTRSGHLKYKDRLNESLSNTEDSFKSRADTKVKKASPIKDETQLTKNNKSNKTRKPFLNRTRSKPIRSR